VNFDNLLTVICSYYWPISKLQEVRFIFMQKYITWAMA